MNKTEKIVYSSRETENKQIINVLRGKRSRLRGEWKEWRILFQNKKSRPLLVDNIKRETKEIREQISGGRANQAKGPQVESLETKQHNHCVPGTVKRTVQLKQKERGGKEYKMKLEKQPGTRPGRTFLNTVRIWIVF